MRRAPLPSGGREVRRSSGIPCSRDGSSPCSLSLQPHATATKPSGFPRFQMHTNKSKYRALPGNAPAPQGRGCHRKFALSQSQSVFHKAFHRARDNPSASPVEAGPERAGPSRAVGQPGSGRSRVGRAAAPQTPPRHPRLLRVILKKRCNSSGFNSRLGTPRRGAGPHEAHPALTASPWPPHSPRYHCGSEHGSRNPSYPSRRCHGDAVGSDPRPREEGCDLGLSRPLTSGGGGAEPLIPAESQPGSAFQLLSPSCNDAPSCACRVFLRGAGVLRGRPGRPVPCQPCQKPSRQLRSDPGSLLPAGAGAWTLSPTGLAAPAAPALRSAPGSLGLPWPPPPQRLPAAPKPSRASPGQAPGPGSPGRQGKAM